MKFQNLSIMVYMIWYASKRVTNGRTNGRLTRKQHAPVEHEQRLNLANEGHTCSKRTHFCMQMVGLQVLSNKVAALVT